jgi:hypothetical protein
MKTRGFLARFFYAVPTSLVGSRRVAPPAASSSIINAYQANMLSLWRLAGAIDSHGKPAVHWIYFSAAGDATMRDFESWLEPQLGENGKLAYLSGWANKLAGGIARIAAILHLADAIADGGGIPKIMASETVEAAINIGRYNLLPHALAAFSIMGADPHVSEAKRILNWLTDSVNSVNSVNGVRVISKRDIHAKVLGGHYRSEDVDAVVELLVKRGYLRAFAESDKQGAGRKPSPRYEIHPSLKPQTRSQNSQNSQNREPGEDG